MAVLPALEHTRCGHAGLLSCRRAWQVHHRGEKFYGPWPVRLAISLHQRYVLWACDKFINSPAFGTGDIDRQEEELATIPLAVCSPPARPSSIPACPRRIPAR